MDEQDLRLQQAILNVSPKSLDFGVMPDAEAKEGYGLATVEITNDGDKILVGRITLQVAWIEIDPPDFRLKPGESSVHYFRLKPYYSPVSISGHKFGSNFIALINSNGGSETIGGYYYSNPEKKEKKRNNPIRFSTFVRVFVIILLSALGIWGFSLYSAKQESIKKTHYYTSLITEAAATFLAQVTANAPAATPAQNLANESGIQKTAQAIVTAMASNATYTPWAPDAFPNPEQFIRTYYETLNKRDFTSAWWMLSEKMQQACCYSGGAAPIDNYRNLMNGINGIDVQYAYLQAVDANPAEVTLGLTFHTEDGDSEYFYTAYIISDSVRNTLLIDEIR